MMPTETTANGGKPRARAAPGFARYAWAVLAYNLAVIVWGVYVRATGSGAGCGGHWPLCNGAIVPPSPTLQTLIEYSHRLSSGVDVALVLGLVAVAWRAFPRGNRVRRAAGLALLFIALEAILGAALARLAGTAPSPAHLAVLALHLTNTFLLLAALTLTAWWAGGAPPMTGAGRRGRVWLLDAAGAGLLVTAMLGAIAAMGDALAPASTLRAGLAQDVSPASNLLVRLRVLHPAAAIVAGLFAMFLISRRWEDGARSPHRIGPWLAAAIFTQWAAGGLDIALLAPVWMQLVHVLCADLVWIAFILFTTSALAA